MNWARDVWPSERARLMSGHMMPAEREAAKATVEILELNSWLEDELKCESPHRYSACSVEVTHRSRGCTTSWRNICLSAADNNTLRMADGFITCSGCGKVAGDCWVQVSI